MLLTLCLLFVVLVVAATAPLLLCSEVQKPTLEPKIKGNAARDEESFRVNPRATITIKYEPVILHPTELKNGNRSSVR